ncbi:MAG: LURP-one-related family protein [Armatimonadota bacterium]
MKQKLFAFGDDFYIKDENGNNAFFVDGKVFSIGKQLAFQDLSGNTLVHIQQKLLAWGPTYELYKGDTVAAVVRRDLFSFFRHRFTVDVPGPDDLEAEGNLLDREYALTRGGQQVAAVSKQWFSWTDTYGVDIAEGEDTVLILASTVVIDMVCHGDKD